MSNSNLQTWVAACLVLSAGSGFLKAGEVPRYAPKLGQVLTYEENQAFKGTGENSAYRTTWRIWVVGKNDDGSFRMVVRESMQTLGKNAGSRERQWAGHLRTDRPLSQRHGPAHSAFLARGSTRRTSFRACRPRERSRGRLAGTRRPRRRHHEI